MPFWKIYHPVGAYTADDKRELSEHVTNLYAQIPIPRFYVVTIFQEVDGDSVYVGGKAHDRFVRFRIDHLARTLPGAGMREWWMRTVEGLIAPFVKDRGFDWEVTIDEVPADLWTIQGEIPPPFESVGEQRWIEENRASPYTAAERSPARLAFTPGVSEG